MIPAKDIIPKLFKLAAWSPSGRDLGPRPGRLAALGCCLGLLLGFANWAPAQGPLPPSLSPEETRREFSRQLLWGRTLLEERDYRGAYISLKQAVTLDPEAAEAWSLLGNTQLALGDLEAARQSWNRAKTKDTSWGYLIDKKLLHTQKLNQISFYLFEFHAHELEGPSLLTASFIKPFADKKIKLSPAAFPLPLKDGMPAVEIFTPQVLAAFRPQDLPPLLVLAEAYSSLGTPLYDETTGQAPSKSPRMPSKTSEVWKPPLLNLRGYRVKAFMRAMVYNLATGALVSDYSQQQEAEGPSPEEALTSALKQLGWEVGEELLRQTLIAFTPRPDLVMEGEDLEIPYPTVVKESAAEIRLRVTNQGEEVAYNFEVTLYEGPKPEGKVIASFHVPSLWPERSVTMDALWNPSALGYVTLTASADVKNLVLEHSAANNTASQRVYVLPEAQLMSNLFDYAQKYQDLPADRQLLSLEKRLYEKPQDREAARSFLGQVVDKENGLITVFGLGPRPLNVLREVTTKLIARRNAQLDAQRWLILALALYQGKTPQEIKSKGLRGASILQEQELPDGSYLVKMQAPLR